MRLLIGIDDTDNKNSRGTGYNARQLASAIEAENLGKVSGITRHQLYVHPDIPYTSQNSSACLDVKSDQVVDLKIFCRKFMLEVGAVGSDVGLSIAEKDKISDEIIQWGLDAKSVVLKMDDAIDKAKCNQVYLEGLTGTKDGIIGALAAIGLRAGGNDGRFIWLSAKKNLRAIEHGISTVEEVSSVAGVDRVQSIHGELISKKERVNLNGWARPVLQNNQSILFIEKVINSSSYEWKCATKEFVKSISN